MVKEDVFGGFKMNYYGDNNHLEFSRKEELTKARRSKIDISDYVDRDIDTDKLREIRLGLVKGIDLSDYLEFTALQIREIRLGLLAGIDIRKYDKKHLHPRRMRQLRLGLESGIDIKLYDSLQYDINQQQEIRLGLMSGIDVHKYLDPKKSYLQMRRIRYNLEKEVHK